MPFPPTSATLLKGGPMKIFAIITIILTVHTAQAYEVCATKTNRQQRATCYADKLAKQYNIQQNLVRQILAVESQYCKYLYNAKTKDYGCMQINKHNLPYLLEKHRITPYDLMTDEIKSIEAGLIILKKMQKRFKAQEPTTWACRYNVGTGMLKGKRALQCAAYLEKLKQH